jgi:hypothetical protein
VQVVAADQFVETVGAFLAADANEISVDVLMELSDLYRDEPGDPATDLRAGGGSDA